MDIRNSPDHLIKLKGCRVIEGFLQILLIEPNPNDASVYDKWSFPELVEVTEYVLLYRVQGLKTLRKLFPNLAVIRGEADGFYSYSLVIFEMMDLDVSIFNETPTAL